MLTVKRYDVYSFMVTCSSIHMRGHISKLQALLNVAAQILALAPEVDGLVQRRAQRMAHRSNRITGDHHAERRRIYYPDVPRTAACTPACKEPTTELP